MTYDPDRTTVMPHVDAGYPITDEYPVVPPPQEPKSAAVFLLKLVTGLVVAGVVVIAGVFAFNEARESRDAQQNQLAEDDPDTSDDDSDDLPPAVEPTVDALADDQPGFWRVTGVPDGLNVRAEPGTQNPIIGALVADQRHVFATGERATVNGAEWKQVVFGDDDRAGWVSARFLTADTAPDENAPPTPVAGSDANTSVVCFRSEAAPDRSARIEFTNRTSLGGVLRTDDGQTVQRQSISGTLSNGEADVELTDQASGDVDDQVWTFNAASVILGDGSSIAVATCDSIPLS